MLSDPVDIQYDHSAEGVVLREPECPEQVRTCEYVIYNSYDVHRGVQATRNIRTCVRRSLVAWVAPYPCQIRKVAQ